MPTSRCISFARDDHAEALNFSADRQYRNGVEPGSADCLETVVKDRAYFQKIGDLQGVRRIDDATEALPAIRAELEEVSHELAQLQAVKRGPQDWRHFSLSLEA